MKRDLRMPNLRTFSFFIGVALAIPLSWKGLTGFYIWLSPYIMINSILALKSFVWLNTFAILVLLFVFFRKRWFCYHLCPVGWSCDIVSGLSKRKTNTYNRLPDFNKWLAVLSLSGALVGVPLFIIFDPLAIFNGFFSIFSGEKSLAGIIYLCGFPLIILMHLFFPSIWCTKLCPLGGLQLVIIDVKTILVRIFKKENQQAILGDQGRRYFLMSGIGLLAGVAIPKILKPSSEAIIRPPAAVEPGLFNCLCCRCGNCASACPTGIIIPKTDFDDIPAWMTPKISFKSGYCLETCNLCSQVCPTGSITLFSVKAKSQLYIGTAEVHLANCLLLNNKECIKCKESCKYGAIEFIAKENIFNVIPVVDTHKCVGCGACEVVCPESCIKINPLLRAVPII